MDGCDVVKLEPTSSHSSRPDIKRRVRGRTEEEAVGVELVRKLLAFIASGSREACEKF